MCGVCKRMILARNMTIAPNASLKAASGVSVRVEVTILSRVLGGISGLNESPFKAKVKK